jgi:hypothetical protein
MDEIQSEPFRLHSESLSVYSSNSVSNRVHVANTKGKLMYVSSAPSRRLRLNLKLQLEDKRIMLQDLVAC